MQTESEPDRRAVPRGVHVARAAGALRIELDPVGRAGAKGLERRTLVAGLGTAVFTGAVAPIAYLQLGASEHNFTRDGGVVLLAFVVGCMWLLFAALAIATIDYGTRRTRIGVLAGVLLVERRSPLLRRRVSVPLAEVASLAVETHYAPLHRYPLACLTVRRRRGDPLTLLIERPRADQEWVRAELQSALDAAGAAAEGPRPTEGT
jgi:hypothetical protein